MVAPHWSFKLARSSDMNIIRSLDEDIRARKLGLALDRPGSFSCTMKIDCPSAYEVARHRTCIIAERNDEPVWSGPIFGINTSVPDDVVSISAMGWFEELNHRFIRFEDQDELVFNNVIGGDIAFALLERLATHEDSEGTVWPARIEVGTRTDTQTRTRSYKKGQSFGSAIMELSDIENGFDFDIHPITRVMTIKAPEDFTVRSQVHFGYKTPPNNVSSMAMQEDGTSTANRMNVDGSSFTVSADDPLVIAEASTMLEAWESLGDVNDSNIVAAYANAELVYRKLGAIQLSIKPKPAIGDAQPWRPFDHFDLGDQVFVDADRGRLQLDNQGIRVFTLDFEIDDNKVENLGEIGAAFG